MGTDIVDMTLNELMDVKKVFRKLDASHIADLMSKGASCDVPSPCFVAFCHRISHTRYHAQRAMIV
jgi:hypothetical protein